MSSKNTKNPGNVYLGVCEPSGRPGNRRRSFCGGLPRQPRPLTEQFRTHTVQKTYWALIEGLANPLSGSYIDWLIQDKRHRRMHVVHSGRPGGKDARLAYRQIVGDGRLSLLEIDLKRAASIKSACNWPITVSRSSAIVSMAVR